MTSESIFVLVFIGFVFFMLAIDLGLFSKADKPVGIKRAAIMSVVWITLALCFDFTIYKYGQYLHHITSFSSLQAINSTYFHHLTLNPNNYWGSLQVYRKNLALEFITGYTVEYALSVDNIFVIILVFGAFGVDPKHYHKVLFWGIIGAIMMRFGFIFIGTTLISHFNWILYLFGAFLVYTGVTMFIKRNDEEQIDTEKHIVVKFASRYFSVSPKFSGNKFFIKVDKRNFITPLFLVLLIIEFTDLVFAVDSIPAVFSVTKDPYIVFFSNIFAILGLRSMFFLLINIIHKFHFLKIGLAGLLVFIGLKMLAAKYLEMLGLNTTGSLYIIVGILSVSVIASLAFPEKNARQ
jgi:tellurite resistance protein TerC